MTEATLTIDDIVWNPFDGEFKGVLDHASQHLEAKQAIYVLEFVEKSENGSKSMIYYIESDEKTCLIHVMYSSESRSGTRKVYGMLKVEPYRFDEALEDFIGLEGAGHGLRTSSSPRPRKTDHLAMVFKDCLEDSLPVEHDQEFGPRPVKQVYAQPELH